MIDLNNSPNLLDVFIGNEFKPNSLYSSSGVKKSILPDSYQNYQTVPENGDYYLIYIPAAGGETKLIFGYIRYTNRAICDLYVNNVLDSSGYDMYGTSSSLIYTITLSHALNPGINIFKLVANGKNASSSGYSMGVGGFRII